MPGPPPVYFTPPQVKVRGPLIPAGDGEGLPSRPAPGFRGRSPARPNSSPPRRRSPLPRLAREAFADHCARRLPPRSVDAAAAARALLEAATLDTPLTAQLRCIRRGFARLKRLARKQNRTDDTPVSPEAFGPLWPPGVAPPWAAEPADGE